MVPFRSSFFRLWLLVVFFLCVAFTAASDVPKKLVSLAYATAVEIQVKLKPEDQWRRSGTGWLYRDQNTIVTAKHVAQDEERDMMTDALTVKQWTALRVKFSDGTFADVKSHQEAPDEDISVLTLDDAVTKNAHRQTLHIARKNAEMGQGVIFVGYPAWFNAMLSVGYVTSFCEKPNGVRFTLSNPIIGGHSGSAVLDDRGFVVGVAVSHWMYNPPVTAAIPVDHIRAAFISLHIDPER